MEVTQAFVVKSKLGHNWVVAGGEQIWLPGAESGHDFNVQLMKLPLPHQTIKRYWTTSNDTNKKKSCPQGLLLRYLKFV